MKILLLTSALAMWVVGAVDTAPQARALLLPTRHIENIASIYGTPQFDGKLFESQLEAIVLLGKVGDSSDVERLIPYLDYPGEGAYGPGTTARLTLETIENHWPAFAAIAKIPHSAEVLVAYAINDKNDLDYRLTVLLVLQYIAPSAFDRCIETMRKNKDANARFLKYADLIQHNKYNFMGLVSHRGFDIAPQNR
jgi:hypothetical protein